MDRSIMIVDDNPEIITLYRSIFQRKGYQVLEALDGAAALRLLEDTIPDIFVLDIMIPEMNGIELCQRIRALPGLDQTPVLILSAYSESGIIEQAFAAGANDYLIKPINARNLEEKVRDMLETARI